VVHTATLQARPLPRTTVHGRGQGTDQSPRTPVESDVDRYAGTAGERMRALCQAHRPALFRFALRLTLGQWQAAEDLTQETLLRAWRNLEMLCADVKRVRPWLFTVARHLSMDCARAKAVRPREIILPEMSVLPSKDDEIERVVAVHTVRGAMRQLSVHHRDALVQVYYRGLSPQEAGEVLGVPAGTVKSRTFYALRALRAIIESPAQAA
jgi:RNA polymerase sigma-70 factor, ECF subfamily